MDLTTVNILAVIVVTLLSNILGGLWYSPKAFGTAWAESLHMSPETLKPKIWQYAASLVVSFVTIWVIAFIVTTFNIRHLAEAVLVGFFLWLGFIATSHFSGVIWARKPLKAYLIDTGFQFVNIMGAAIILTFWRW